MSALVKIGRRIIQGPILQRKRCLLSANQVANFSSEEKHAEQHVQNDIHDIIITGGGMVGAAMAAALGTCI